MTDVVPVRIAGELVMKIDEVPFEALEQIKSALTFANEEREKQSRERVHGWWDLPETICLYKIERRRGGDLVICLPRGFASQLVAGFAQLGIAIAWDDQRSKVEASPGYYKPFALRDYQFAAAIDLIRSQQGFYKSPAGSGKTVTMLGVLAWINQRALVIVDKADLVEQWRLRAADFYDMPTDVDDEGNRTAAYEGERSIGKIGEGIWEERDLTVCLRQTLFSRLWETDSTKWWEKWGAEIFDEGHHLAAETVQEVSRRSTSFYLFGTSATPAPSPTRGKIVHALVGPIVHETPKEVLYERGILMRPTVEIIPSDFKADFWDTHDSWTKDGELHCNVPGCKKTKKGEKHYHRNNYSSVLKKLVEDKDRNAMIAQLIVADRGHIHLVGSRQKKHLDLLRKACQEAGWPEENMWYLRGEENARGESQAIVQAVQRSHEGVIFSTVAQEGLDIPPIDRVWQTFPIRAEHVIIQYVGRGERVWPGKEDAIIKEVVDPGCEIFKEQHDARTRVYRKEGYIIAPTRARDDIVMVNQVMVG